MTLDELIEQVVDDRVTLNSVLLRAKVLAYNLHADNLKIWLEGEINGYNSEAVMPVYRTNISVQSVGTFTDGFRMIRNHPIPLFLLSNTLREFAQHVSLSQSIAALQGLIDNDDGDNIKADWPSDVVTLLNTELDAKNHPGGYIDACNKIGRVSVQAILDNTRNRLLTFLMELREQYPNLDISRSTSDSNTSQTAQILVNNYIYGDKNMVASGREFTQSVTKSIKDLDSLLSRLQELGVEQKDLETLEQAVVADQQSGHRGIGNSVKTWLGDFTAGVASSHVATNLPQIVAAIGAFFNK
jgi:hypothetical protein